jgi:hypothetical protein
MVVGFLKNDLIFRIIPRNGYFPAELKNIFRWPDNKPLHVVWYWGTLVFFTAGKACVMSSIRIAEYLDEDEAFTLRERLKTEGIEPVVKRHGLPRMFGVDSNYRIFIDRVHAEKGKTIVEAFLTECGVKRAETRERLKKQCPICQSANVTSREKTSFLLKLRFFGVQVWRCKECGSEWYI